MLGSGEFAFSFGKLKERCVCGGGVCGVGGGGGEGGDGVQSRRRTWRVLLNDLGGAESSCSLSAQQSVRHMVVGGWIHSKCLSGDLFFLERCLGSADNGMQTSALIHSLWIYDIFIRPY